ncbi:hypothetical protein KKD71_03830, partial [Patescibacteria group bacterium]|nr:hypothetical protein [Patescibacteria group bacterium]
FKKMRGCFFSSRSGAALLMTQLQDTLMVQARRTPSEAGFTLSNYYRESRTMTGKITPNLPWLAYGAEPSGGRWL